MSLNRTGNALLLAFRKAIPVPISARLGGDRLSHAIAQAQANGWTDPEWLARIAVADTAGLASGPAAAKILAQLEDAARQPCPDRTPIPPRVFIDPTPTGPPARDPSGYAQACRTALNRGSSAP